MQDREEIATGVRRGRGIDHGTTSLVGEYGSIVFVSGNIPFKTEIAPYLIVIRLEQYDYHGATAIAAVLMVISFVILACINWLEVWASRFNHSQSIRQLGAILLRVLPKRLPMPKSKQLFIPPMCRT